MYRTNWGIGHSMKEILEAHKGPFTGEGHVGLYELLTTSWHAQLAINLALFGSLSIIVAHHMYAMPPYPYLATDYGTQLSLFTHHMWIGGFCVVGAGAHAAIFMVRDYDPTNNYNNLLDRVIRHRDAIISHLNWVCIFLGFHSFGLYIHNDTMSALGRPQDMFSDTAIQLQPVFAQWVQKTHFLAPQFTAPNALAATSATWGGDVVAVGGKVAMMPISLGTSDFLVWLVLGQVKLRCMLEPLVFAYMFNISQFLSFFSRQILKSDFSKQIESHSLNNFSHAPQGEKNFLFGRMKNLFERVNQQVTCFFNEGTSETIREAISFLLKIQKKLNNSNFDFTDYASVQPQHIQNLDHSFLIWFIGFVEGDGSFWTRDSNIGTSFFINKKTKRAEFEITQKIENIQTLKYIRTKLGFGRVLTFEKNGFSYCRFYTSKKENIIRFIFLFNGNLILEKRREQFLSWLKELNFSWGLDIQPKPFSLEISLENSWLSGFSDADAGFYTNVKTNFRGSKKPKGGFYGKFITKFYITQKEELHALQQILHLFESTNKIATVTNGKTSVCYNRIEILNIKSSEKIFQYFEKFPLKTKRKIDYSRWVRVHSYKNMHVVLTDKAAIKLARLVLNIEEPFFGEFENSNSVFFLSEEEISIFENLPKSQSHRAYISKKIF
jgi:hypothetical protein